MRLDKGFQLPDPNLVQGLEPAVKTYLTRINGRIRDLARDTLDEIAYNGVSGTEVIDDGTTRLTRVIVNGKITSITTAASSGATISWTET